MALGGGAFGRSIGHEGGALTNRMSAFMKAPLPLSPCEGTVNQEAIFLFLEFLLFILDISQEILASACEIVTYS